MVDYGKLADRAKALQNAADESDARSEGKQLDPLGFFDSVKSHLVTEMHKANVELGKRGLATLDRSFSPSFSGRFCFTFGTSLFCSVELDANGEQRKIKSIISGPPNGGEVGRREYHFSMGLTEPQSFRADDEAGVIVTGLNSEEIAIDIVSSILMGEFS